MKKPANKLQKSNGETVSNLLKYIDYVLDNVRNLEVYQSRNPHVDKAIRTTLATAYHETQKYVEKIRANRPEIKDVPADSTNPKEYLRSAHTWCVGQLYWEDGERIGAEKATADLTDKKRGEPEQKTARGKLWRIRAWFKALIKEAYRLAMRSFFDSAMHK